MCDPRDGGVRGERRHVVEALPGTRRARIALGRAGGDGFR